MVHLWRVDLHQAHPHLPRLQSLLSEDELERAARYHFDQDRYRFVLCRGSLRVLLGQYLDQDPGSLQFVYGSRGKPVLAETTELCFNVSHSQDYALIGCVWNSPLGIDLEYLRPLSDVEQLSQRFFKSQEHDLICACLPTQRLEIFFRLWTAKEACLKALGLGLVGLEAVELTLTDQGADLVQMPPNETYSGSEWEMIQWIPCVGYLASLAIERRRWEYNFWEMAWSIDREDVPLKIERSHGQS